MASLKGISHGDEMLYLFPLRENISPSSLPTAEDEQIRLAILRIFVDFARSGYLLYSLCYFDYVWYFVSIFVLLI